MLNQDLHIHTVFSEGDSAVVPEQTVEFIANVVHSRIVGISDHIECMNDEQFEAYTTEVRKYGLKLGVEVDGARSVYQARNLEVDYYIYHCYNEQTSYDGIDNLLATEKPVIIAHPLMMGTDLSRVPRECFVEINNRYVWRYDWRVSYEPFLKRFKFVFGSDAHQPNWLNQNISRYVARELNIQETLIF